MIERKEIDLASQSVFGQYIHNLDNSTYNFTNMYMWAGDGDITYGETDGCLAIFFQGKRRPLSVSYPVGDGDRKNAILHLSNYIRELDLRPVFRNLSREMVAELESLYPGAFEFVEDRAAADYIYETEKMITLSGKKLHAKRNHYNFFKNNYAYVYRQRTAEDMPDCMALFERWLDEKENKKWIGTSREATAKLLGSFAALPVRAGGLYVEDELIAFSVGEPVTEDTVLVHLEFAADIRGAFNVINSEFCAHEWPGYTYVNREEDMGLDGLRQTKLAYRPVRLLEKFNAVQIAPLQ